MFCLCRPPYTTLKYASPEALRTASYEARGGRPRRAGREAEGDGETAWESEEIGETGCEAEGDGETGREAERGVGGGRRGNEGMREMKIVLTRVPLVFFDLENAGKPCGLNRLSQRSGADIKSRANSYHLFFMFADKHDFFNR